MVDKTITAIAAAPSEGALDVYSNHAEIVMSFFDFKLKFQQVIDVNETTLITKPVANVVLSPQHMKAFVQVLVDNMKKYEETFGEIKLPDHLGIVKKN